MKYEIKLSAYEGPLDLLLALISKAKIEIKDIFISQITEQYLEFISREGAVDMDSASDFVQMAATLLYIKSRALLPRTREEDLDDEGLTPEERLVKKLHEYKRFKEISEELRSMEAGALQVYHKLPEELTEENAEEVYLNATTTALAEAFARLMAQLRTPEPVRKEVVYELDHYSVREQIRMIMARLTIQPEMSFRELLSETPNSEEVAVTFLSMLQLVNKNRVKVEQERVFGEITVVKNRNRGESGEKQI